MQKKTDVEPDIFDWIFIAKGIGILFVVIGHFHPKSSPTYWPEFYRIIYSFHMPLFFILSGYLYNYRKYSYYSLIKAKTRRLLYPFISIALVFFLIKCLAGSVVTLDRPVSINSIYALLVDPINSYMPILWFVYALFLVFAIYPLVRVIMNNHLMLLLFIAINAVFGNDYLIINEAMYNMPFFVIGVILRENLELFKMSIGANYRYAFVSFVLFSLVYIIYILANIQIGGEYLFRFFLGVTGALLVINASHTISSFSNSKIKGVMVEIGYYSMTIYLFHTLFVSTVRIGFLQVFQDVYIPFELIAFVAVLSGIVFPLLLEKKVLRKFWITKKFVLGLKKK